PHPSGPDVPRDDVTTQEGAWERRWRSTRRGAVGPAARRFRLAVMRTGERKSQVLIVDEAGQELSAHRAPRRVELERRCLLRREIAVGVRDGIVFVEASAVLGRARSRCVMEHEDLARRVYPDSLAAERRPTLDALVSRDAPGLRSPRWYKIER